jgi:predicted transcriptional regulator with HTH domain
MVPTKENPKWAELLKGNIQHKFTVAPAAMMVSKCERSVHRDPSPQNLEKNLVDLHAFFTKYEKLVSNDLVEIFR